MTRVVPPNVITRDQETGVQPREIVPVTEQGFECAQSVQRGWFRLG